jgi:hypothetical protein
MCLGRPFFSSKPFAGNSSPLAHNEFMAESHPIEVLAQSAKSPGTAQLVHSKNLISTLPGIMSLQAIPGVPS